MSSRRTIVLIAAVVIGLIAAVALWSYIDGIEDRAYEDATLVQVYRVDQDIPKGMPGEQAISEDFVSQDEIPQEFRPGTALTDVEVIRGKVALTDLSAGQVVVDGMFVDPRVAQITFSQRVPAGQVAISMSISGENALGGFLVPGDRVSMIVTDPSAPPEQPVKRFLFQNVNILAIGATAAPEPGEAGAVPTDQGLITFAVPPLAAEKIALVGAAEIRLVLGAPDYQPQNVPPVNAQNLFTGGLTPYPEEG